ncbi:1,2-phenylacetyl-CoA epoxidase subunit PaaD [Amycolatopsis sp. NBC_01286]|uniref:1,2-phenylacetyl-CoA epoxidase subunit PaaD n=1 Tax=Amycolatopsis sp. NBC_01286 TaxID=2903560 RepID=UPI002E0FAB5E|nr:phenylacetate-CoA oxygenase subunit PaaJ [Amycolatopsis sp. NBC_01286]
MVTASLVAATVTDPELPMLTLADLGVLRSVSEVDGRVVVAITPTYTGCPAMDTMRDDLEHALLGAGYADVEIRTQLAPSWTSDWITSEGRRKLAEAGIAPPGAAPRRSGPIPLTLSAPVSSVPCPLCGSTDTEEQSRFGATACKALRRCRSCQEPFEHVKEI